ncbi:MAG TPA: metallopeptidase family protein [Candidatus Saccharimonadales bacterium]|jgi:predicted Zn-dependent protease with MMP-like domain
MVEVSDEEFESMVEAGVDAIPERFASRMENVAVTWASWPDFWQRVKSGLKPGRLLFGLYEGIPKTRRGNSYSGVLPDKITIFKLPLQQVARDQAHLRELVKETVWHEVAHHFGLDDHEIHRRQKR